MDEQSNDLKYLEHLSSIEDGEMSIDDIDDKVFWDILNEIGIQKTLDAVVDWEKLPSFKLLNENPGQYSLNLCKSIFDDQTSAFDTYWDQLKEYWLSTAAGSDDEVSESCSVHATRICWPESDSGGNQDGIEFSTKNLSGASVFHLTPRSRKLSPDALVIKTDGTCRVMPWLFAKDSWELFAIAKEKKHLLDFTKECDFFALNFLGADRRISIEEYPEVGFLKQKLFLQGWNECKRRREKWVYLPLLHLISVGQHSLLQDVEETLTDEHALGESDWDSQFLRYLKRFYNKSDNLLNSQVLTFQNLIKKHFSH